MNERHAPSEWLTAREMQVLQSVALGFSAKEIAKHLLIAPRTVERHIDHIRLKTRTRNRSHMVAFALTNGMIGDDTPTVDRPRHNQSDLFSYMM
ncbi:response regulator transcription factor [Hephaestia sp. GCM10023244]|uniref:response regulator transcription factor n=1 Tax=unclassified Hephaestia TaxID=2631281 RepID=UPI002076E733|nr:helix-turn-helix transcriptional regulator [Hephaestia sp. MAHUQ-44]MCM8731672.1 helix-turn-helix transcriptional regulator [Hephaestia sp. MAHUQ-44]